MVPLAGDFDIFQFISSQITYSCISVVLCNLPSQSTYLPQFPTLSNNSQILISLLLPDETSSPVSSLCVPLLEQKKFSYLHSQLCMSAYRTHIPTFNSSLKGAHFTCFIALTQTEVRLNSLYLPMILCLTFLDSQNYLRFYRQVGIQAELIEYTSFLPHAQENTDLLQFFFTEEPLTSSHHDPCGSFSLRTCCLSRG